MKFELEPGNVMTIAFANGDDEGVLRIHYKYDRIQVEATLPDTQGRAGIIYEEIFGAGMDDFAERAEPVSQDDNPADRFEEDDDLADRFEDADSMEVPAEEYSEEVEAPDKLEQAMLDLADEVAEKITASAARRQKKSLFRRWSDQVIAWFRN